MPSRREDTVQNSESYPRKLQNVKLSPAFEHLHTKL